MAENTIARPEPVDVTAAPSSTSGIAAAHVHHARRRGHGLGAVGARVDVAAFIEAAHSSQRVRGGHPRFPGPTSAPPAAGGRIP